MNAALRPTYQIRKQVTQRTHHSTAAKYVKPGFKSAEGQLALERPEPRESSFQRQLHSDITSFDIVILDRLRAQNNAVVGTRSDAFGHDNHTARNELLRLLDQALRDPVQERPQGMAYRSTTMVPRDWTQYKEV